MRNVIKRSQVRLETSAARNLGEVGDPCAGSGPPPGLRLVRVDGTVQAIEITCRCGEVTLVELEYETPGPEAAAPAPSTPAAQHEE